jgi:hypothetical protein
LTRAIASLSSVSNSAPQLQTSLIMQSDYFYFYSWLLFIGCEDFVGD